MPAANVRQQLENIHTELREMRKETTEGILAIQEMCFERQGKCQRHTHARIDEISVKLAYMNGRNNGKDNAAEGYRTRRRYDKNTVAVIKEFWKLILIITVLVGIASGVSVQALTELWSKLPF